MAKQVPLTNIRPIVDANGILTQEAREFFNNLASQPSLTGSGSPEGVVEANVGVLYMDTTGSTGSLLYAKKQPHISNDFSKGWELV